MLYIESNIKARPVIQVHRVHTKSTILRISAIVFTSVPTSQHSWRGGAFLLGRGVKNESAYPYIGGVKLSWRRQLHMDRVKEVSALYEIHLPSHQDLLS